MWGEVITEATDADASPRVWARVGVALACLVWTQPYSHVPHTLAWCEYACLVWTHLQRALEDEICARHRPVELTRLFNELVAIVDRALPNMVGADADRATRVRVWL